ncbi:MAG: family 1 glycosylhydrolase [Acidimicrobiales bacterium]
MTDVDRREGRKTATVAIQAGTRDVPARGAASAPLSPEFLFGVATAGFQVEGGYNRTGQPANNWLAWEQVGRVAPSGNAVGFWDRPEQALDRAAELGCNSFRFSVEWARVFPEDGTPDKEALIRYAAIVDGCLERDLTPLVTLHHFTHPAWLGEHFWLRPDAAERFRAWVEIVVDSLGDGVRHWVTINEINVLALGSWVLGMFPPGGWGAVHDMQMAVDSLLTAHVRAYEAIHSAQPDATVTTNNTCLSLYECDRLLIDLLMCRSCGIERREVDDWIDERRARHDSLLPAGTARERMARRFSAWRSAYGRSWRPGAVPRRVLDAVYDSPYERTLDALGLDFYQPMVGDHFRLPGHRTAGGRSPQPSRALWDDPPDPDGLRRWLGIQHSLVPGLPLWIVENGLCNRVVNGRSYPRVDGWNRPRYLRANIAAVMEAVDQGVPVTGYWHWSLVDNYEWGSYEPRFGLYGIDRDRGEHGTEWMTTDAMGADSAGAYRDIIAGLRRGDRSVLDSG